MTRHWLKSHWFSLLLATVLSLIAIAKYRGGMIPIDGIDLAVPYSGARAWLAGENPYDGAVLLRHFLEAGGKNVELNLNHLPPVYPPITFVVLAPMSRLNWDQAIRAWELGALILVALLAGAALNLAGIRFGDPRAWLFVLFCIVFAPLRSAITLSQLALPSICLATLAALVLRWKWDALSGVMLAFAIAFKLQDALFVLLYVVLIRRWRVVAWCAGVLAGLSLIAIVTPGRDPRWVFGVLDWIQDGSRPGSIMDAASPNPARFQMIHLPILLNTFMSQRSAISLINFVVCGPMLILACRLIWRKAKIHPQPELLSLALIAVLSLLSFYHRFPDATMLVLPMAWAMSKLSTSDKNTGRITLLLLLPFLLQPYDSLRTLLTREIISRATYDSWWFQCFARASIVWILLILACWLLFQFKRQASLSSAAQSDS